MSNTELDRQRWKQLWADLGAQPESARFEQLRSLYAEPGRAYHNATHILACLHTFDGLRDLAASPLTVELAIWYHDAIYDPTRQDNEARSADLAVEVLASVGLDQYCQPVHALIMATDHRQPSATSDQRLLVDIDLSILAAAAPAYQAYTEAVRREYGHFPDALYRPGRAAVLKKFLERPEIFTTEPGKARWEQRARENLEAEIRGLA